MRWLILLTLLFTGCIIDPEENYDYTVDDLLNKSFYELNEALPNGVQTTRIMFDNPKFKIEEDNYATVAGTGEYTYLHTLNIFGQITKKYNTETFQVIEFYITNITGTGYKYYSIKKGYYDGVDCLKLVEMKQQQYVNTSGNKVYEWVEWWHGQTVYLYEY